jgi:hypothetical protein
MSPQAFLASPLPSADTQTAVALASEPATEVSREKVRLLVIGSSYGVERVIHELYRVGFAEVREWSKPLPRGNQGEVMRIFTRYVMRDSP